MHRNARRGACVLLPSLLLMAAATAASAAWSATGQGSGPGSATTATAVTPIVPAPTCTWNSTTKVLTVTVTWSKSSYATSSVSRTDVATGITTLLVSGLASSVMSYNDSSTISNMPGNGKLTTGSYTYTVTAGAAGTYWARSGTSAPKAFSLTSATGGKNPTPDTCT